MNLWEFLFFDVVIVAVVLVKTPVGKAIAGVFLGRVVKQEQLASTNDDVKMLGERNQLAAAAASVPRDAARSEEIKEAMHRVQLAKLETERLVVESNRERLIEAVGTKIDNGDYGRMLPKPVDTDRPTEPRSRIPEPPVTGVVETPKKPTAGGVVAASSVNANRLLGRTEPRAMNPRELDSYRRDMYHIAQGIGSVRLMPDDAEEV